MTWVYAEFHVIRFFIVLKSFNCALSVAKYQQWKIKTSVSAQKRRIDRALPKIQSNLVSRTSSQAQLFRIDSGIDLIVKTHKEDFQIITAFGHRHSSFITSQWMFVPVNIRAEKILCLSNIQQMSAIQQWELFVHVHIHYKIEADNQLHNCVCEELSIKDGGIIKILAKSLQKRVIFLSNAINWEKNNWVAIASDDFISYCKSDLLEISNNKVCFLPLLLVFVMKWVKCIAFCLMTPIAPIWIRTEDVESYLNKDWRYVTHETSFLTRNKLRLIRLMVVTAVTLLLLLNDEHKLESLQEDGSRTRQEIPQIACCKARTCNCFYSKSFQYRTFCTENSIVNCSIPKRLFSKYAWLIFCSYNATKISVASCRGFHSEIHLVKT